jgi:hypothetical protein
MGGEYPDGWDEEAPTEADAGTDADAGVRADGDGR